MKKIIFIYLLLLLGMTNLQAQFEKSNYIIGGSTRLSADIFSMTAENLNLAIYPQFGIFINKYFVVGAKPYLAIELSTTGDGAEKSDKYYYGIIPFSRFYWGNSNYYKFFSQVEIGILGEKIKSSESINYDLNPYGSAGIGISYLINKCVGLEPILDINSVYGLGLKIGFQVYINRIKTE
jgi:hypothetical protein